MLIRNQPTGELDAVDPPEAAILKFNERLRILHQIDKALVAGEDPAAIAAAALPHLRELLGARRAIVNLFDLAKGEVEWLAAAGRRRTRVGPGVRFSIGLMGDVNLLKEGQPQLIDVDTLPPGPEVDALRKSDVHAYVVVPMIAKGELIGALSFGGPSASFSTEQVEIAKEAAAQFAIALAQARLHEQVKRQAKELADRVQELRESEELFRNAFEHTNVPMVLTAIDHRFLRVNGAFARMFGYEREELLNLSMIDITHPDDVAESLAKREQLKSGEIAHFQIEKRYRHKRGHTIWGLANVSLLRDSNGRPSQYVGRVQDITTRKQLEEQLRQAQKMEAFGQLAGGVAHDFNNLLTVILGYSEVILAQINQDSTVRNLVTEIRGAGNRAASLTRQLLAFSRKQVLEPKVLDLNAIVTDMEKMLRRLIGEDITLTAVLAPTLGKVKADPGQIEQVILNLAVNARDAMPQGGNLTIETADAELDEAYAQTHSEAKSGSYVMLAMTDTGCGMDDQTKARIFEPFFTTKGQGRGTGLGLATVFGIVKQSEGNIYVYSEPGKGTTFKIYLPLVTDRPSPARSSVGHELRSQGNETLILVEDDEAVRDLSRLALQMFGYTVLTASSGQEAVRICEQHGGTIDLLVSDVVMPEMGGREVAGRLQAMRPDLKVLYLSGYTDDAVVRHGVLAAEAAFLQKPFTPIALANKVREVLAKS